MLNLLHSLNCCRNLLLRCLLCHFCFQVEVSTPYVQSSRHKQRAVLTSSDPDDVHEIHALNMEHSLAENAPVSDSDYGNEALSHIPEVNFQVRVLHSQKHFYNKWL